MQEDFFPAAEKILSDIYQIFIRDPELKSFEIISALQNGNKSPIHYEEHCLGLESWCVPYVYCYAYKSIMKIKETKQRVREAEKCNLLLIGALLLNPEVTTLWNMRKELINFGKLDPNFELHFTAVLATFKPKCANIYSFRKWLLQKMMTGSPNDTALLESEVKMCEDAVHHYSNNYHAWTQRTWCLSQSMPVLLDREWADSLCWVACHVSDYSGFHYRQKLISFILDYIQSSSYSKERIELVLFSVNEATESFIRCIKNFELSTQTIPLSLKIFIHELCLDSDLIWNYIGHETLWCHRRYIFHEIKKILFEGNQLNRPWGYFRTSNHSTAGGGLGSIPEQFSLILSLYEETFLKKCSEANEPRQICYANKHKQWLERFCNFQLPYELHNYKIEISSPF